VFNEVDEEIARANFGKQHLFMRTLDWCLFDMTQEE